MLPVIPWLAQSTVLIKLLFLIWCCHFSIHFVLLRAHRALLLDMLLLLSCSSSFPIAHLALLLDMSLLLSLPNSFRTADLALLLHMLLITSWLVSHGSLSGPALYAAYHFMSLRCFEWFTSLLHLICDGHKLVWVQCSVHSSVSLHMYRNCMHMQLSAQRLLFP